MIGVGTQLGPIEILAPLGRGGMGEVFRARDSRIGREVAVKVLPAELAKDPERVRRFQQEARAVGQLSHPNLLTLHDLGAHQGQPYLVTELLEGLSLRELLARERRLPPRQALDLAAQIASGLAAAHAGGVVHRDLKPANVFVVRDGRIKILDFGLAKLLPPAGAPVAADGPTLTALTDATEQGAILGTVGYMAPEQIRGGTVGPGTDLFALGAVLYEMLSGERAFAADSAVETLGAILHESPPAPSSRVEGLSPAIDRVVSRCLEKSPEARFQSARDLAFVLGDLAGGSGSGPLEKPPARRLGWPAVALGLLGMGLSITLAVLAGRWSAAPRSEVPRFEALTYARGYVATARFVPGESSVVYSASWDGATERLFLKQAQATESLPLSLEDSRLLAVSSRGDLALLLRPRLRSPFGFVGTLARQPLAGGAPRELMEEVAAADWRPDGEDLAVVRELGGRQRLEYPPGHGIYETGGWLSDLRFSPDGGRLAFLEHPVRENEAAVVMAIDLVSRQATAQAPGPARDLLGLAWSPDGRELLFGSNSGELTAAAAGRTRLLWRLPASLHLHDVATNGRLLLSQEDRRMGMAVSSGQPPQDRDLSWLSWSLVMAMSDDGSKILFSEFTGKASVTGEAALRPADGSPEIHLGPGFATGLSPDGLWAAVLRGANPSSIAIVPTGAGEGRLLPPGPLDFINLATFLPDGRRLVIAGRERGDSDTHLYLQSIENGEPVLANSQGIGIGTMAVSPDADTVASLGVDGRLWLYPLDGQPARPVEGTETHFLPLRWERGGRSLLVYRLGPGRVLRVDLGTGSTTEARSLKPADPAGIWSISPIVCSADEGTWAYSYFRVLSTLYTADDIR